MATIELIKVEKKFGDLHAVKPMDLTIHDGEFVVLLGPSGCGKTTTLRMISGLEAVTGGQILLNQRDVTWEKPSERDIAFVFQFFAGSRRAPANPSFKRTEYGRLNLR